MSAEISADQAERRELITKLVAEILELDDPSSIRPTDRLREDLGMDSLGSLELLSTISEELDLDLEMEDAMGISTMEDAFSFIEQKHAEQHANE